MLQSTCNFDENESKKECLVFEAAAHNKTSSWRGDGSKELASYLLQRKLIPAKVVGRKDTLSGPTLAR